MKVRRKQKRDSVFMLIRILLFALFSYAAVRGGITAGNFLFGADVKLVKKADVGLFKTALNSSIPLIDTVYNSGNASVSFSNEIMSLVDGIFGFNLNIPLTVLNAQSSLFYRYYLKDYPKISKNNTEETGDRNRVDIGNEAIPDGPAEKGERGETGQIVKKLPEDASSISFEEEEKSGPGGGGSVISSGRVSIQNETGYKLNIDEMLEEPLKFKFDKKGPKILIYHTHTTESYLLSQADLNKGGIPNRRQDARYNVVRVGEELAQTLRKKYGIEVIHNGTIHDYPNYNSSYGNSLKTVSRILKSYPSIRMTLDIHRDALGIDEGKMRTATVVNGKKAAQVMFVVGTDQNGLKNPNWKENLILAVKLQERLSEKYPGLAKPIDLSRNRYNEHVTNGSLLIEIGGDGDILGECLQSAKFVADVINDVVNGK